MSTAQTNNRTIRQAECDWDSNGKDPGEVETKRIRFLFYSPTVKEMRDAKNEVEAFFKENPGGVIFASENLIKRLHSFPEFAVGVGQKSKLTIEWLELQDLTNLDRIRTAIDEALTPKAQPGK